VKNGEVRDDDIILLPSISAEPFKDLMEWFKYKDFRNTGQNQSNDNDSDEDRDVEDIDDAEGYDVYSDPYAIGSMQTNTNDLVELYLLADYLRMPGLKVEIRKHVRQLSNYYFFDIHALVKVVTRLWDNIEHPDIDPLLKFYMEFFSKKWYGKQIHSFQSFWGRKYTEQTVESQLPEAFKLNCQRIVQDMELQTSTIEEDEQDIGIFPTPIDCRERRRPTPGLSWDQLKIDHSLKLSDFKCADFDIVSELSDDDADMVEEWGEAETADEDEDEDENGSEEEAGFYY
jgi:hypothetical protein